MNHKLLFKIFCLDSVKDRLKTTAAETLHLFKSHNVFNYLNEGFDVLHTQSQAYIVDDILDYMRHN